MPGDLSSNFFDRLDRDDSRYPGHDFLVQFRFLQVVAGLQSDPYFWRTAKQACHLEAHDRGEGFAPRQNAMKHLARYAQGFRRSRHRQAHGWKDVFLYDLARMDGRHSVLFLHGPPLVVVFEIDIRGVFSRPAESDPVAPGHAHRPAPWTAL